MPISKYSTLTELKDYVRKNKLNKKKQILYKKIMKHLIRYIKM